ncbi:MAG TPA: hypothetical protein VGG92_04090 [Caulobacteraceae bacterium]
MSHVAPPGDVVTMLVILFAVLIAAVAILRLWVLAIADLLWIGLIRRRLALEVLLGLAFLILVAVYSVLPQKNFAPVALPLFVTLLVTPILAVPLINLRARRRYDPNAESFALAKEDLARADVFSLQQMRLLSVYRAPESEAPIASSASPPPPSPTP